MNIESMRAALIAARSTIDSVLAQLDERQAIDKRQPEKRWMSLSEAEKYTGKTRRMLTTMAKNGQIEHRMSDGGGKMFVLV